MEPNAVAMARVVPGLIDDLLASLAPRTVRAYLTDLDDFARVRDRDRVQAIAELLAGGAEDGRRVVLTYAAHLSRRGRAPATIDRRLGTLRSLVRLAERRQLIDW